MNSLIRFALDTPISPCHSYKVNMKKGLKTLIAGILLFLIGSFVVPLAIIMPVILGDSNEHQFIIPGSTAVEIVEPGRYYLWNDFQTVHDGKSYNRSESIPDGLEINVKNEIGSSLLFSSDTSISSRTGPHVQEAGRRIALDMSK